MISVKYVFVVLMAVVAFAVCDFVLQVLFKLVKYVFRYFVWRFASPTVGNNRPVATGSGVFQ